MSELVNRLNMWAKTVLYDAGGELRSVSEDCETAANAIIDLRALVSELREENKRLRDRRARLDAQSKSPWVGSS